jgi:hypothetical protein
LITGPRGREDGVPGLVGGLLGDRGVLLDEFELLHVEIALLVLFRPKHGDMLLGKEIRE